MYKASTNKHRKVITFKPGDLVWIHLRKERFPSRRKKKFILRSDGPFNVLEKVNDNAYKLELPGDMCVSSRFNVSDLTPYLEDEEDGDDLRANHIQEGKNEANVMTTQVTTYLKDEATFMPTQVQESSHILFNTHKLHHPCAIFELQFQPHHNLLNVLLL